MQAPCRRSLYPTSANGLCKRIMFFLLGDSPLRLPRSTIAMYRIGLILHVSSEESQKTSWGSVVEDSRLIP